MTQSLKEFCKEELQYIAQTFDHIKGAMNSEYMPDREASNNAFGDLVAEIKCERDACADKIKECRQKLHACDDDTNITIMAESLVRRQERLEALDEVLEIIDNVTDNYNITPIEDQEG